MKKKSSLLGVFIVLCGLLSQTAFVQASGFSPDDPRPVLTLAGGLACIYVPQLCIVLGAIWAGTEVTGILTDGIVNLIKEGKDTDSDQIFKYERAYKRNPAFYGNKSSFLKSEFPEAIETRIDALINQEYIGEAASVDGKHKSFPIFPTPKSKIFVLQNIEDFFELPQEEPFKNYNLTVYEKCVEKINELERKEPTNDDKRRDTVRDAYKQQRGISTATLKNMSPEDVDKKIKEVKDDLSKFVKDMLPESTTMKESPEAYFAALVSVLTHLYYKQSKQKPAMFVGKGLQEGWKKPELVGKETRIREKAANLKGITTLYTGEAAAAVAKKPQDLKFKPQNIESLPAKKQQSFVSQLYSAWASWWYGAKKK